MKKILFLSVTVLFILSTSCSKSDDSNSKEVDSIFDAEFVAVKSLQNIEGHIWAYKGSKIGNRKVGLISESSCMSKNVLTYFPPDKNYEIGIFEYVNYQGSGVVCDLEFITKLMIHYVKNEELYCTFGQYTPTVPPIGEVKKESTDYISNETVYTFPPSGSHIQKIEIGYQAGYLRMEDKLTNYNGNEKVYLYFKKIQ